MQPRLQSAALLSVLLLGGPSQAFEVTDVLVFAECGMGHLDPLRVESTGYEDANPSCVFNFDQSGPGGLRGSNALAQLDVHNDNAFEIRVTGVARTICTDDDGQIVVLVTYESSGLSVDFTLSETRAIDIAGRVDDGDFFDGAPFIEIVDAQTEEVIFSHVDTDEDLGRGNYIYLPPGSYQFRVGQEAVGPDPFNCNDPRSGGLIDVNFTARPACSDGIDNDGDNAIDGDDQGCASGLDQTETEPDVVCDDGIDNDGDGFIDFSDPGCANRLDPSELGTVECDDASDNDRDGRIDASDPGCSSPADTSEFGSVACDDGTDNDGDDLADYPDDPGCRSPKSRFENPQCQDGLDNDGQLGIDFDGGAAANGGVALDVSDPQCTYPWRKWEFVMRKKCGLGYELTFLVLPFLVARARRWSKGRGEGESAPAYGAADGSR